MQLSGAQVRRTGLETALGEINVRRLSSRIVLAICAAAAVFLVLAARSLLAIPSAAASPQAAAPATPAVRTVDRAFVEALAKSDRAAVAMLLDNEFSWTQADGRFLSRSQVERNLPKPVLGREVEVERTERNYGQVEAVHVRSGKKYILRVWVERPDGWRLIVYHEIVQPAQTATSPAAVVAGHGAGPPTCDNPCKDVPFKPQTAMDDAIIKGWQAQQTGEWHNDGDAWGYDIADEFIGVNTGAAQPTTKPARIAAFRRLKAAGVETSATAPLVSARMFDFGETAVMTALHKTGDGYSQCSRIWVHRDDHWQMAFSYQTKVEKAAPEGNKSTSSVR